MSAHAPKKRRVEHRLNASDGWKRERLDLVIIKLTRATEMGVERKRRETSCA
jgi:hypothetical protein